MARTLDSCAVCGREIEPETRYRLDDGAPVHMLCRDGEPLPGQTRAMLAVLRTAHPDFDEVADLLVDLANDATVSPELYTRVCDAVFVVLNAWADSQLKAARAGARP